MEEIVKRAVELAQDQYGNYVVQHVVEFGKPVHKEGVMKALKGRIADLSRQKYSSNVIEKCLKHVGPKDVEALLLEILGKDSDRYFFL
jgi:pumilio RNA-binding family